MGCIKSMKTDVVVIGGGAAGMMCAYTAACGGSSVVLLEPNRQLGRKVRITGKGRCNVCNNCDEKTVLKNIPGDGRFLYSALNRLSPAETMAFFESLGVPLKTERGNRVFPVSDRAHDIADALANAMTDAGVQVLHTKAKKILTKDAAVSAVVTESGTIECTAAVISTGGLSYPATGSTGDGYRFAKEAGHTVTETRASLVPLESDDPWCPELQGFSLRNVTLTAFDETNKPLFSELGEMLFTHFGVSGPLVLSASAHLRDFRQHQYRLEIDLKPGLDEKKLDARVLRDFEKYANREYKNALFDLTGRTMVPVLVRLSGIPEDQKVNTITRDIKDLAAPTGNIYETVVILAKRANQIALAEKKELAKKLEDFRGERDTMDEVFENKEQIEISKYYERQPKPDLVAISEFEAGELYYRVAQEDGAV